MAGNYRLELTFIDNASVDRTAKLISELRAQDRNVQLITHSRNFGYQASLFCPASPIWKAMPTSLSTPTARIRPS